MRTHKSNEQKKYIAVLCFRTLSRVFTVEIPQLMWMQTQKSALVDHSNAEQRNLTKIYLSVRQLEAPFIFTFHLWE